MALEIRYKLSTAIMSIDIAVDEMENLPDEAVRNRLAQLSKLEEISKELKHILTRINDEYEAQSASR